MGKKGYFLDDMYHWDMSKRKSKTSVMGVEKIHLMVNFYLNILGLICHRDSLCDCVHRRDYCTFTQYCFDWEEHSVDTFNPHEDSPHLNKNFYCRAKELIRILALNIE